MTYRLGFLPDQPRKWRPSRKGAENIGLGLLAAGCVAGIFVLGRV